MKTENVGIDIFQYFLFTTIGERIKLSKDTLGKNKIALF